MKQIMLNGCGVVFNAEHHTYTLDGKELSGITSIISKYIFPDMYSNVSESVLETARQRGSIVHSELEMEFNGIRLARDLFDGNVNAVACIGEGKIGMFGLVNMIDNVNRILDRVAIYLA